ncbi:MAG: single-stranded-DNA-specific exonuclease RecJ [Armatimonadota bacterium]
MPNSIYLPKNWRLDEVDVELMCNLAEESSISKELSGILILRGICSLMDISQFLQPDSAYLHDPLLLDGLELAVKRTAQAIRSGELIMIHGDYDVDGVTASALLVRVLRILKADVSWYVPHRQKEGYDISRAGVDEAIDRGVKLIITVDCGSSAIDPIRYAREKGIDVIVTDHHEVGETLAPANAIINPHKPGCEYPFKQLAGVGVAFKFAEALVAECGLDTASFRKRFYDLAAVGTVADVVPLLGENRVLVKSGLDEMPSTGKKGLKALMQISGMSGESVNSQTIAFGMAPRLNAAGRIDDASLAVELLLTTDDNAAMDMASELDSRNKKRQSEQERIVREALEQIAGKGLAETSKVFVLASSNWHAGIVGIVAGRITERYCRPSILIAMDEEGEAGVGSARSIKAFDMYEALTDCRHLLSRYGGHSQAAGLSISSENLDEFSDLIRKLADDRISADDMLPLLDVDCEIPLSRLTKQLAHEIKQLEPYGHCNKEPVFMTRNCVVSAKRRIGQNNSHLKLSLKQGSGKPIDCLAWGWGEHEEEFALGSLIDVCYNIRINTFNGTETAQAILKDARVSDASAGG